jgi:hypothetical protein
LTLSSQGETAGPTTRRGVFQSAVGFYDDDEDFDRVIQLSREWPKAGSARTQPALEESTRSS